MAATDTTTAPVLIDLPRDGYAVYWKADTHAYQRVNDAGKPGLRYPSVSTIAKAFPDSPDGLMRWVETMTCTGFGRLIAAKAAGREDLTDLPTEPYALRTVLGNHGLRYEQIRDAAAQRGTNVHVRVLEALAKGGDVPDLDELDPDEQGYGQAVFKWWMDRKPKPTHVEQAVLSLEHEYAGRFDLRCQLDAPIGLGLPSGVGVVDLKTASRPYRAGHVQLRGYEIAAEECGIGTSEWAMILQVQADGEYVEHFCAAERDDFLVALDAYRRAKAVDRKMK